MKVTLSSYVGYRGLAFTRVCLAFQAYGYQAPTPDTAETLDTTGAYVMNIVGQYQAHLSQDEALAIIWYGLTNTQGHLKQDIADRSLLYPLDELVSLYTNQLEQGES